MRQRLYSGLPDRLNKLGQTLDFAMLNEVYNRRIIELAGTIPRIGRLAEPDATATALSRLCGSTVTIDLKMDGDTVTDFAHEVKACALGQASSSIMARNIIGSKADELRDLREVVRKMLKENGAPPAAGKWADIAVLEPVRDYKARHASTLLTFDAVVDAIGQIEKKRGAKARRSRHSRPRRNTKRNHVREVAPSGWIRIACTRLMTGNERCRSILSSTLSATPLACSAAAWSKSIATRSPRSSAFAAGICRPARTMPTRRWIASGCGPAAG